MRLRHARVDEADELSSLCHRSKAHWSYDEAFMTQSRASLTVSVDQISAGDVGVAEVEGAIAGMVALARLDEPGLVDLDKLFIEPSRIGTGVGQALFGVAVLTARQRGYVRMAILADPHAAKFYERLGAAYLGDRPSEAIAGRLLPYFELTL